ncbi:PPA2 [Candida pseudojiufengensis]|uniref:PPA2 n=1 Tax=Candida pseudojiufengensis TaxID=497109 RepID=UPI002224A878|nr:PPA2 [Candida pseudojiufengensis]KAI5963510.1 PPA2 [Candida pseudojiufengensis]
MNLSSSVNLLFKNQLKAMTNNHINPAIARLALTKQHLTQSRTNSSSSSSTPSQTKLKSSSERPIIIPTSQGKKYSATYANYATTKLSNNEVKILSYFHDISLDLDPIKREANFICEIPRWSNAKFEIATKLPGNPIVQDVKNGKVRFVKNLFPHHGYIHNYGAFPQTWEDPFIKHYDLYGDNDPLDVCEIGSNILNTGDVKRCKILGSLALIDDGELDWKVIVIDIEDELSQYVNDIEDVRKKCPGLLEATKQWFKDYKLADSKPENKFAFNGNYKSAKETIEIIQECHKSWQNLISGKVKGSKDKLPSIINTTIKNSPGYIKDYEIKLNDPLNDDDPIPIDTNKSYYF